MEYFQILLPSTKRTSIALQKNIIYFSLFFIVSATYGQSTPTGKKIYGKVTADYNDLEGIYIVNLKTEKATLTERGGYFAINVSIGDTLLFSSVQFKGLKVEIQDKDFNKELFFVKMETLVRLLDEVRINEYKNINAVSLGIIPASTKHYTPAERKLKTASDSDAQFGTDTKVGLDPLINWISGRTAMLKKEVEVEKKETLLDKIEGWYEEKYFLETLKIPEEYVKGFQFYIVEDSKFVEAVKSKNKTMATFIMKELAVNYKELLATK